jgi:hypothetical protein
MIPLERERHNDPFILPELGKSFNIRHLCEEKDIELSDASWKTPVPLT